MSTTIDERVVEMRFDNKHFENNVADTMSTLEKFKQKLNLTGAAKGLEEINTAAKRIDLSPLGVAAEKVGLKFNAMYSAADQWVRNMTTRVSNAAERMVKAFTIDPVKTGLSEYETQINAVQTILANTESKGTTLQQVNAALDQLNTYADKTIYNFTEMTRNIGTFTAAGVDLNTSVSAIKGIANLAAVSGSTSQQASTAMYQLSQALAAGKVSLMDWNSVVNAGMGGQVFQDALKRTAKVMGKDVDGAIKKYGSFRESLSKGEWLTTDVLTKTLEQFTMAAEEGTAEWEAYKASLKEQGYTEKQAVEILKMANTAEDAATKVKTFSQLMDTLKESAQSGWTQTWEILLGDFGEAKQLFTSISNELGAMIGSSAESRNKMLSGGLSTGWKQLLGAGISDEAGFKEEISKVAKQNGYEFDKLVKNTEEAGYDYEYALKQAISDGNITADTLSTAVTNMSDKMGKMSAKELEAAGYTKEHVIQIQKLAKGLKDGSISMEEFVEKMKRPSGRENLIDALWNSFSGLMSVLKPVKEAFRDIFPAITGEQLYSFTVALREFTSKLTLSEKASENLKRTFKGVFAIFDIGKKVLSAAFDLISPIFGKVDDAGGGILAFTAKIGDAIVKFNEFLGRSDAFGKTVEFIHSAISVAYSAISKFVKVIKENVVSPGWEIIQAIFGRIAERMGQVERASGVMRSAVTTAFDVVGATLAKCRLFDILMALWNGIKTIGSGIAKAFGELTGGALDKLSKADFSGIFDLINTVSFSAIGVLIAKFIKGLGDLTDGFGDFKDGALGILEGVKDTLDGVKDTLEAYQQQLKAKTLMEIAKAIALLVGALVVLSLVDSEKLAGSTAVITVLFGDLIGAMAIFNKMGGTAAGLTKTVAAMQGISVAILILSAALANIARLEPEQMAVGVGGIFALTAIVVAAAKVLSAGEKKVIKGAVQMVIFAAAIKILASVCKDLSTLNWDELGRGLTGVGALMGAVALFLSFTKFGPKGMSNAIGMVIMAGALKIMASVCADFARMSWEEIGRGLTAVGVMLTEISMFATATGEAKHIVSTSIALVAIGAAMKIFASAVEDLGSMDIWSLVKGVGAMAGVMTILALSLKKMPMGMTDIGVGMVGISVAMVILSKALATMGGMDLWEIIKSMIALGGSMAIMAVTLRAMEHTAKGSGALMVASVALAMLAPVLNYIGSMSLATIGKGLLAIAGTFVILGVAGALLTAFVPTIFALAKSIALLGVGVLAAGVGLTIFAYGISALGTALAVGSTAFISGLSVILIGILSLIPSFVNVATKLLVALCDVIIQGAPAVGKAIVALILATIDTLVQTVPALVNGLGQLIVAVLEALVQYTPQIVTLLADFIIKVLDALSQKLPALIQAGINFIMAFFSGIVQALKGIDINVLAQGVVGVGIITALIYALSAIGPFIPGAMVGVLGVAAVIAELTLVLAAIGAIAQIPGLDWIISEGGNFLQLLGTAIGQFIGGIAGGIMGGISSQFPKIGADLSAFMLNAMPFIMGCKMIDESMMSGVRALAETVLILTAAGILQGIASFFGSSVSLVSFGAQLPALGSSLNSFAANLGTFDESKVNTVTCAANAVKALAEASKSIPNEGGWAAKIFGENSIASFGEQLPKLGTNLSAFAKNLGTFDDAKVATVNCAANAVKSMADAANKIPNEGGWAAKIFGENSLASFGTQMEALGTNLKNFAKNLGTFGEDKVATVNSAVRAINALTGLANADLKGAKKNLEGFGDKLVGLASDMSSFVTKMPESGVISTALKSLKDLLNFIRDVNNSSFAAAKEFGDALKNLGKDSVKKFVEAFKSSSTKTDVENAAVTMMIEFIDGMKSKQAAVSAAAAEVANEAAKNTKNSYDKFYDAGSYLVEGFARGITSNMYTATAKARAMAKAAADAAEDELDINSPSKVFRKIGTSIPEGFAMGIDMLGGMVGTSSKDMAMNAVNNVRHSLSNLSTMLIDDIDAQPTIRPVLDLSDVRSGVGALNGMLDTEASIGTWANLNAISSAMGQRSKSRANNDVVSAINRLRGDIGNIGGTTYQINGISYEDGSSVGNALKELVRAIKMEGRV